MNLGRILKIGDSPQQGHSLKPISKLSAEHKAAGEQLHSDHMKTRIALQPETRVLPQAVPGAVNRLTLVKKKSPLFLPLSIHSTEIQVDYFEREGGILTKVLETVVSAKDVPLSQTFQEDKSLAEVNSSSVNSVTSVYTQALIVHTTFLWLWDMAVRLFTDPNCICWHIKLQLLISQCVQHTSYHPVK